MVVPFAVDQPFGDIAPQGSGEAQSGFVILLVKQPPQRCPQVVVFNLQSVKPCHLLGALQRRLGGRGRLSGRGELGSLGRVSGFGGLHVSERVVRVGGTTRERRTGRVASGGGPIQTRPESRTASAKSAFSDRKP